MEEKLRDMGAENRDMGAELRRVGAELRRVTADMNVIKNRLALFLPTEQAAYVVKVLCNQPGATKASRKEVRTLLSYMTVVDVTGQGPPKEGHQQSEAWRNPWIGGRPRRRVQHNIWC